MWRWSAIPPSGSFSPPSPGGTQTTLDLYFWTNPTPTQIAIPGSSRGHVQNDGFAGLADSGLIVSIYRGPFKSVRLLRPTDAPHQSAAWSRLVGLIFDYLPGSCSYIYIYTYSPYTRIVCAVLFIRRNGFRARKNP